MSCSASRTPSRRSSRPRNCWRSSCRTWSRSPGRSTAGSRQRFELVKAAAPLGAAERQAGRAEQSLPSLPRAPRDSFPRALGTWCARLTRPAATRRPYQIVAAELARRPAAFEVVVRDGRLLLLLNSRHPLYRDLYGPLATSESARDQDVAKQVALAVLAAARAEVSTWRRADEPRPAASGRLGRTCSRPS